MTSVARGFIGAGDVYIERLVGGVSQGRQGPYYANKFEIKPNIDLKQLESKGRNDYGQVLESVALQKPADFTLELKEVNKESMTLALLGSDADSSQTGGTMTAHPVVIKKNYWVEVGFQALDDTMLVKDSTGVTTYVEGTDYILNRPLGMIKVLSTSAIADAATLKFSGDYADTTATLISGAVNADIRAAFIFDGINLADGLPCTVRIREGVIAANNAFDFLASDFSNVTLPGKMKTPVGFAEPFTVELRTA